MDTRVVTTRTTVVGPPVVAPPGYVHNQFVHPAPATVQFTTTTTTSTAPAAGIRFNPHYLVSPPGILKIVQVVFAVIVFSCSSPVYYGFARLTVFVSSLCFTCTLFLCAVYLFSVREWLSTLPWLMMEMLYTVGACGLYALGAVIQLVFCSQDDVTRILNYFDSHGAYIAAGVFALFNAGLYGVGSFFLFSEYRQTRVIRGQVVAQPPVH